MHKFPRIDNHVTLPDGRKLGYSEYGDPNGAPVLYFHGSLSSRLDVAFAAPICRELKVRLLALDRPGIGISDFQPNRTLLDWPKDVANFAESLGIKRFPVLGWSMGGPYALACAAKLPDLITRAGLVGGVSTMTPEQIHNLGFATDRMLFFLVKHAPWLAGLYLQASKHVPPVLMKKALLMDLVGSHATVEKMSNEEVSEPYVEGLRSGAKGTIRDYQIVAEPPGFNLEDIQIEVILWQGEHDKLCPMTEAQDLNKRIPNSKLIIIPQQGHFLLHVKIAEVLRTLLKE